MRRDEAGSNSSDSGLLAHVGDLGRWSHVALVDRHAGGRGAEDARAELEGTAR